ncbi:hypothetical protein SO802_006143 [Lithocarpus litseifolius]|uniref:Protein phosphatase n=1 Tax=Lithocarpus litseifolius TaxID=425828 RepID=A0AAW2DPA0_9ROSI
MKMSCGALYLPKDDEDKPLGEDAHFICAEKQTIGVADGVGGWAKKGVQLKRVLGTAFLNTKALGSSTACIVTLKQDYYLHAIYVDLALYNSFDRFFCSPYARAARKAGKEHRGGKIDDITVIVAHILPYV